MKHRELCWLALVLSGCGGAGPARGGADAGGGVGGAWTSPDPNFRDGTRLFARTFSAPGTAVLLVGIYDRQERVECEFGVAADKKLRCLPANSVGPTDPATADLSPRWQEGTEVVVGTAGRVSRNEIHSTDGGRFPNWVSGEFHDEQFGQPCRPDTTRQIDGTGVGLCLPNSAVANGVFFSDAACAHALASADGTWPPFLVVSPDRQLFALGDAYTGPAFISFSATAPCMEYTGSGTRFFAIGDPLSAGAIAPVQMFPRGNGRLRLQMIESEGRPLAPVRHRDLSLPYADTGPYFDSTTGVLCRPTWTAAGEVRCVPADSDFIPASWLTNFADPACTQPVLSTDKSTAVVLRSEAALARQVVVEVRRVLPEPSATAYKMVEGVCREYLKGAGHPLGEVVPLESFARVDARTGAEPAP